MTVRRLVALAAFNAAAFLIVVALVALATWQIHRRAWKLDLIARVEARIHAAAMPAPTRDHWSMVSAAEDEYRRVTVRGHWLESRAALVKAVTERGEGYWLLSPFRRDDGTTILINRGFVPADASTSRSWESPPPVPSITGKLRLSEPGGAFLRTNDPEADRWFSREVHSIAVSRELSNVAPYFIDAEPAPGQGEWPVAGLTVISFSNNHLAYALTWGVLALMAAAGTVFANLDVLNRWRRLPGLRLSKDPAVVERSTSLSRRVQSRQADGLMHPFRCSRPSGERDGPHPRSRR